MLFCFGERVLGVARALGGGLVARLRLGAQRLDLVFEPLDQHLAARRVRGLLRLQFGQPRARLGRAGPALIEVQFQRVEARAYVGQFGVERRCARRSRDALGIHLVEVRAQALALFAPRGRRAQVAEDLEVPQPRRCAPVALGAPDLRLELGNARGDLADEVADADAVVLGLLEPAQRLSLASEELADAGGLFEQAAALGRLLGEHRVDLALRDDRVRARPETGAHEHLDDVAQPDLRAVDEEFALARAVGAARHLHFAEADAERVVLVVERERHLGHAERLAPVVADEDHVLGLRRAQRLRTLLAERPADRVHEIRLAGPIGTDERGDPGLEHDLGLIGERLEAEQPK